MSNIPDPKPYELRLNRFTLLLDPTLSTFTAKVTGTNPKVAGL